MYTVVLHKTGSGMRRFAIARKMKPIHLNVIINSNVRLDTKLTERFVIVLKYPKNRVAVGKFRSAPNRSLLNANALSNQISV